MSDLSSPALIEKQSPVLVFRRESRDVGDDSSGMNRTSYALRPRSGGWKPDHRLVHFDMTVKHDGKPLGGHDVQVVLGAPDETRRGLDEDVAMLLDSGWWVALRNHFARAPCVAVEILESVREPLNEITAQATDARGEPAKAVSRHLFESVFHGTGPDYWS